MIQQFVIVIIAKRRKMQNQKSLKKNTSCTHIFGYKYSKQTKRLNPFSQIQLRENKSHEEKIQTLKTENQKLQLQLNNIKSLLFKIIHPNKCDKGQATIDQLLKQLFQLVLSKSREAQHYKQQNDLLKEEVQNLINKSSSSVQSKIIDSNSNNYLRPYTTAFNDRPSQVELSFSKVTNKNRCTYEGLRWSEESNKTRAFYKPRVLFQIGKEVKTVNQFSSNNLLKKQTDQISSSQLSFKQLNKLKGEGNRMSIQESIYGSSQDELQKINIYSNSHGMIQDYKKMSQTVNDKQSKNYLFQIQQQKSNDIQRESQLKGLTKIPKRPKFTFQTHNNF